MNLTARSRGTTWFAFTLGAIAFAAVIGYLRPNETHTRANASIALIVLVAPLATKPPATIQRLLICAVVWAGLGTPGAYVFGSPVFYAGCLLGVVALARLLLFRPRGPAPTANSRSEA